MGTNQSIATKEQTRLKSEGRATEYGKRNGEVFTPDSIIDDMLNLIDTGLKELEDSETKYYYRCSADGDKHWVEEIDIDNFLLKRKRLIQNQLKKTFMGGVEKETYDDSWCLNGANGKIKEALTKLIEETYFEPTCGNGNILINILMRKLAYIDILYPNIGKKTEYIDKILALLKAVSSIYGVDINPHNVLQARDRMFQTIFAASLEVFDTTGVKTVETVSFEDIGHGDNLKKLIKKILENNIQYGNTLNSYNHASDEDLRSHIIAQNITCSDAYDETTPIKYTDGKPVVDLLGKGTQHLSKEEQQENLENRQKRVNVIYKYDFGNTWAGLVMNIGITGYILQECDVDSVHYEPLQYKIDKQQFKDDELGKKFIEYKIHIPEELKDSEDENDKSLLLEDYDF